MSCSLLRVQIQYLLSRNQLIIHLSLPVCPFVRLSLHPSQLILKYQQSSICREKKKSLSGRFRLLCRTVRSGKQKTVLAMQGTEPVCQTSRYLLSCKGQLCPEVRACIHGRGKMILPGPEVSRGDQDMLRCWVELAVTCAGHPGDQSCGGGQGTHTELSVQLLCAQVILALIQL